MYYEWSIDMEVDRKMICNNWKKNSKNRTAVCSEKKICFDEISSDDIKLMILITKPFLLASETHYWVCPDGQESVEATLHQLPKILFLMVVVKNATHLIYIEDGWYDMCLKMIYMSCEGGTSSIFPDSVYSGSNQFDFLTNPSFCSWQEVSKYVIESVLIKR